MVQIGGIVNDGSTLHRISWEWGTIYAQDPNNFDLTTTEFRVSIVGDTIQLFADCTKILEATDASRINKLGFNLTL